MQKISACLIVKNEEGVLERCLESIYPWVDEIVIVDTGSTDNTVEIAKKFTSHVYHFEWVDDFSAARNYSIDQATGDWIFFLDADDVVPEGTGSKLRMVVGAAMPEVGFFLMKYMYPRNAVHDAFVMNRYSLFRNDPRIRFNGRVHEQVYDPAIHTDFKVVNSSLITNHFSEAATQEQINEKSKYYLSILEKEIEDLPEKSEALFHLAMTYHQLERHSEAIAAAERFLQLNIPYDESRNRKLRLWLVEDTAALHDLVAWRSAFDTARKLFPDTPDVLVIIARTALDMGEDALGQEILENMVVTAYEMDSDMIGVGSINYWPFMLLARLYVKQGRLWDALPLYGKAYSNNPNIYECVHEAYELCLKLGENETAQELKKRADHILELLKPVKEE